MFYREIPYNLQGSVELPQGLPGLEGGNHCILWMDKHVISPVRPITFTGGFWVDVRLDRSSTIIAASR